MNMTNEGMKRGPAETGVGKSGRNLGVDLLRCVAMLMIACLHIINRGAVAASAAGNGAADSLLWPLRTAVACGVNIYALISGYVTVYGRFRPARVAELWIQVLFWNLTIAAVGSLLQPGIMDGFWLRYCLPLTQKCFWYFTAYVGVYVFSPLLNRGIQALNARQCRALAWTMLLLFSLGTTVGYANQGDPWSIGAGYSVLWLLTLYVTGACLRHGRLLEKLPAWKLLCLVLGSVLLNWTVRELLTGLPNMPEAWQKHRDQLLYYTNPTLAAFSVGMLGLFSRLSIHGAAAKLTKLLAPLTFGVYIIHVHHVNWVWIENLYRPLGLLPPLLVGPAVIGAGLGLYLVCCLLDGIRDRLFRLLRLRQGLDALERRLMARTGAE